MIIRNLKPGEISEVSELMIAVAQEFNMEGLSREGRKTLLATMSPETISRHLQQEYQFWVAIVEQKIIGVIAMYQNRHLYQLFVDKSYQHQAVATHLWHTALAASKNHNQEEVFTVNASLYAVPVYQRLGFCEHSDVQHENGLIYQPMKYQG